MIYVLASYLAGPKILSMSRFGWTPATFPWTRIGKLRREVPHRHAVRVAVLGGDIALLLVSKPAANPHG